MEASFTNRMKEIKKRISGNEDTVQEMNTSVKNDAKSKKLLTQIIQEILDTEKPNLRKIGIEKGEEFQVRDMHKASDQFFLSCGLRWVTAWVVVLLGTYYLYSLLVFQSSTRPLTKRLVVSDST